MNFPEVRSFDYFLSSSVIFFLDRCYFSTSLLKSASYAQRHFAAMSLVDSTAVFESRARTIGLSDQLITDMGLRGWNTHATFAFAAATQPGADEQLFADRVIIPLLQSADHQDAPKLRRLFFEAHTLTAAELRRKVDSTEQEQPRKLPAQEIAQRIEMLQARITPLIVANFLEPSHHLINSLVQCVEDGRVRYIEWSRCTSRTQEVNNVKEDPDLKIWKADSTGAIKATSKEPSITAVLNTELDVQYALRRRGVAYEVAQAMSFEVHEAIVNYLFFELKKEPMEGFSQVTLQQVAAADRELHVRLAEQPGQGFVWGRQGNSLWIFMSRRSHSRLVAIVYWLVLGYALRC